MFLSPPSQSISVLCCPSQTTFLDTFRCYFNRVPHGFLGIVNFSTKTPGINWKFWVWFFAKKIIKKYLKLAKLEQIVFLQNVDYFEIWTPRMGIDWLMPKEDPGKSIWACKLRSHRSPGSEGVMSPVFDMFRNTHYIFIFIDLLVLQIIHYPG